MNLSSPQALLKSIFGPEQAQALLDTGAAPSSLARTALEAIAPPNLPALLQRAGLTKAEVLSGRLVKGMSHLIELTRIRADRAIQVAGLRKAEEELVKRSHNVKEKTTNITPEQAEGRRVRYAQSLGLNPVKRQSEADAGKFPKPSRSQLPYSGNFPVEHEMAHAMMTPGGKTVRQYTDDLGAKSRKFKTMEDKSTRDGADWPRDYHEVNEAYHNYHDAEQEENTARMMERHIDRRSGVNPNNVELQAGARIAPGAPKHSFRRIDVPHEHPFNNHYEYSDEEIADMDPRGSRFRPKNEKQLGVEARSQAAQEMGRWDAGSKFKAGKVAAPTGIDAKINARAARAQKSEDRSAPEGRGANPKQPAMPKQPPTRQMVPGVFPNHGAKSPSQAQK